MELTAGVRSLAETKTQRGIFKDALSTYDSKLPWCHLTTYSENALPDTNLVDRRKKNQSCNAHG